jgi:6-phosphogluconolactonase (cycloisomerase 2 family)
MHRTIAAAIAAAASLTLAGTASAADVYTLTNQPTGNAVAAFDRAPDGSLSPAGTYATGGIGTGAGLGSQGSLALSRPSRWLFAVNAGSDSISLFAVHRHGLELASTVPSGGVRPISLTSHGRVLYVLNAGSSTITGFRVGSGTLTPIPGSTQPLGTGSSGPAQISFSPSGRTLVVTEKTSSTIDTYRVGLDGRASAPVVSPAVGATPFGFDFDRNGNVLVSNASGSASSYALAASGALSVISGAVPTFQAAPCWLVTSVDGRFAYTANAGAGTLSGFAVGQNGSLSLLDPSGDSASFGAGSHPLDEAVSKDGQYLYDLVDGLHHIASFAIGADGSLAPTGISTSLPAGTIGLAAR